MYTIKSKQIQFNTKKKIKRNWIIQKKLSTLGSDTGFELHYRYKRIEDKTSQTRRRRRET